MDPSATLSVLIDAACGIDTATDHSLQTRADTVREAAENLAEWIERGGFAPSIFEALEMSRIEVER